jgi:hypothetical protein
MSGPAADPYDVIVIGAGPIGQTVIDRADVDLGEKVIGASLYADGYTGRARMVVDEDHGYLLRSPLSAPAPKS